MLEPDSGPLQEQQSVLLTTEPIPPGVYAAAVFLSPAFVSNFRVGEALSPAPTLYLGIPFSPSRVDSLGPTSYLSAYTGCFYGSHFHM